MALWGFVQISKFYRVTVWPYSTHHHRNISSQRGQDVLYFQVAVGFHSLIFRRSRSLVATPSLPLSNNDGYEIAWDQATQWGKRIKNGVKQQKISASEASLDTSRGLLRSLIIFFALPDFFLLFPSMRSLVASKLRKRQLKKVFALL